MRIIRLDLGGAVLELSFFLQTQCGSIVAFELKFHYILWSLLITT
jgi:hypothetical protein